MNSGSEIPAEDVNERPEGQGRGGKIKILRLQRKWAAIATAEQKVVLEANGLHWGCEFISNSQFAKLKNERDSH